MEEERSCRAKHGVQKRCVDELLAGPEGNDVFGKNRLIGALKKALAERMLNAEVIYHLTQGAAEPGVFSDTAESQSSSRSLIVAFS